jgi:putative hydrolase of the HAD superfamily
MQTQLIIFDLDDTLVHCNLYFERILDTFAEKLSEILTAERFDVAQIRKKQQEIDLIGVEKLGFTLDHFPQSLVDTYTYFCKLSGQQIDERYITLFRELGRSVYELQIDPYPNMIETLNELKAQGHILYLYTGGVSEVQIRKVNQLGLEYFFENRIHVARHKTIEEMDRLLYRIHADRSNTWMVGNSPRTDIVPALEAGIHAIYIPTQNEWEYNLVEVTSSPKGAYYTLEKLSEVPAAIANYIKKN